MANVLWFILYVNLLVQGVLVLLLCLPMPSNSVRGFLIGALSKIWRSSHYLRYTIKLLVVVNILSFLDAIRVIHQVENKLDNAADHQHCREQELKMKLFVNQRNSYITGFNVFLSLVFYRLFVTMKQIHEWRKELKEREQTEVQDRVQQEVAKKQD